MIGSMGKFYQVYLVISIIDEHFFKIRISTRLLGFVTRLAWNPRRTNRPLTALATRLTLIHEEGRTGRCPRVLTDEC